MDRKNFIARQMGDFHLTRNAPRLWRHVSVGGGTGKACGIVGVAGAFVFGGLRIGADGAGESYTFCGVVGDVFGGDDG